MPVAELHFFHADDPNGSTIFECTTDDEWVKGIHLNIERDSLGGGTVTFARKVPAGGLFQREIVVPETLVRILVPAISETKYYHAFFINPRQQQVVSKAESGGEGFIFGGPGPKHYLERMLLWSASFAGNDNAVDREGGVWTWPDTARAGAILNRLFLEDQNNPNGPFLPDLSKSFGDTNDSDGVPWAEDISTGNDDFSLRIQDSYLKILWILEDLTGMVTDIDLGEVGAPLLQLNAYQTYGNDLSASVLFEEGVNIAADLDVEGSSYAKASHALVRGDDGVYELAVRTGWTPGDLRKVVPTAWDTSNNTQLDLAGERFLNRQQNGEKQIKLHIIPGTTALAGEYFPGPPGTGSDFWIGDTVSLTTGMVSPTDLDYNDEPQAVTGIELELLEAARDDTTLMVARSWDVTLFLNEERKSSNTSRDLAGNRGTVQAAPSILRRCRAATGSTSSPVYEGGVGTATDSATSDYPFTVATSGLFMLVFQGTNSGSPGTTAVQWFQSISGGAVGPDASPEAFTLIDDDYSGSDHDISAWGLQDPDNSTDTDSQVIASHTNSRQAGALLVYSGCQGPTVADAVRASATATGTSTAPSVTLGGLTAGDKAVAAISYHHGGSGGDDTVVTPPADWIARVHADAGPPMSSTHDAGIDVVEMTVDGSGTVTATWTLDTSRQWMAQVIVLKGESSLDINDGNEDLVGTSKRVSRCDHRHDVHRDTAPTVDDDFATAGYKLGTIWAQLDDLEAPTEIVAVFMAVDVSEGAAIWLEWPGGGVALSDDTPLVESGSGDPGDSTEASRSDHVHPEDGGGGGAGGADDPQTGVQIFDELFLGSTATAFDGNLVSLGSGSGAGLTYLGSATAVHPGTLEVHTGTTSTGFAGIVGSSTTAASIVLGSGQNISMAVLVAVPVLSDGSQTFFVRCGLSDTFNTSAGANEVGFRYSHGQNGGEWQGICAAASSESVLDTNVAVVAGTWYLLEFVITGSSSVEFFVNGVSKGTLSTNIPSVGLSHIPVAIKKSVGGTSRLCHIDFYKYRIEWPGNRY